MNHDPAPHRHSGHASHRHCERSEAISPRHCAHTSLRHCERSEAISLPASALLIACTLLIGCAQTTVSTPLPDQARVFDYNEGRVVTMVGHAGACSMAFQGRIGPDFEATIARALTHLESQSCHSRVVTLDSGGGLVAPALRIGERLRQLGYTTEVAGWNSGRCASACGLLFIAGVERVAKPEADNSNKGAGLGVHQSSRRVGDSKVCLPDNTALPSSNARVHAYVKRMLPPQGAQLYLQLRLETDCRHMRYLTQDELIGSGIATATSRSTK